MPAIKPNGYLNNNKAAAFPNWFAIATFCLIFPRCSDKLRQCFVREYMSDFDRSCCRQRLNGIKFAIEKNIVAKQHTVDIGQYPTNTYFQPTRISRKEIKQRRRKIQIKKNCSNIIIEKVWQKNVIKNCIAILRRLERAEHKQFAHRHANELKRKEQTQYKYINFGRRVPCVWIMVKFICR